MNESIKKMWIEALESGDYRYCSGTLRTSDGRHCAVGVLCELYKLHVDPDCQPALLWNEALEWSGLSLKDEALIADANDILGEYPIDFLKGLVTLDQIISQKRWSLL